MTHYILIGLSVFSASLSGMENQLIPTDNVKTTNPLCNKEKETLIFFDLLNQCISRNNQKSQEIINQKTKKINETIENFNLPTLTKVLAITHYYDVETTHKNKEILKESLFSMFLQRIEKLPFDLRGKYINNLDLKLQNDLLFEFITKKNLPQLLQTRYNTLKEESGCSEILLSENNLDVVFAYEEDKKFANKGLTLEKAMLAYDIITEKRLHNYLKITDEMVSAPVKIVLDTCSNFIKIIKNKKDLEPQETSEVKSSSLTERFKQLFIVKNLFRASMVVCCTCLAYMLYHNNAIQNYFSPYIH